ncbi:DUF6541 family protein [Pseudonocardia tropica]|uniref:DUF6541 family protein n=1 Tax=Pseudonocardia tropica TaxID=681289 RepID=A0ABV1JNK1_9PSEU
MGAATWLSAAPVALVAALWVVVPGLLVLRASGLRGITVWAASPLLSITLIALSAVAGTALGIPWGSWSPMVPAVSLAAAALLFRGFVARRPAGSALHRGWRSALRTWGPGLRARAAWQQLRSPRGEFARRAEPLTGALPTAWKTSAQRQGLDGWYGGTAAAIGVAVGAGLGWVTVVRGFGPVDSLSSTYDAVFHYNGIAHILRTGDASSLTLGTINNPAAATALYPAAWHDLVSLVALGAGTSIPQAVNMTAWAVAALVFPLSALLLTRQLVGRSAAAAFAAPVLASGFTAAPWMLMSFGVLWPNMIGIALLPASIAVLATLFGAARESALRVPAAALIFVATLPGLALSHPNAVFSLAVIGFFPILWGLGRLTRYRLFTMRLWQPALGALLLSAAVTMTLWLMFYSPLLSGVRSFDWPAFTDTPGAVVDVVTNSMNRQPALSILSGLVLVGLVGAFRRVSTSWLVPAHAASGFLYVMAASREDGLSAGLTGAWYNDSYRLAAMVPVTGVPLAVIGLLTLAGLTRRVIALLPPLGPLTRRRWFTQGVAVTGTIFALAFSGGMNIAVHSDVLAEPYQRPDSDRMLNPDHREFLVEASRLLPPNSVVAENPFTGNALLFALTNRQVLFPHLGGNWTADQQVIAARLRDAASDPQVCAAVTATQTTHVLTGDVSFWPRDPRAAQFPGLDGLDTVGGFTLLAQSGATQLWQIDVCDRKPIPNSYDG